MSRLPPVAVLHVLRAGGAIPAHPLALTAERRLDERRQRALTRYYADAGAIGVAVGVHTTQFEIRDAKVGLFKPVLALAGETLDELETPATPPGVGPRHGVAPPGAPDVGRHGLAPPGPAGDRRPPLVRIAGICGPTPQAVAEARLAADLGYHVGLLSLAALRDESDEALVAHARAVGEAIPLMGFYLQPAVGGRALGYAFWRRFVEIPAVVAVKVAPFSRYQTVEVARAVADAGRADEIALYTGNDDAIVADLVTEYAVGHAPVRRVRFTGGLLGQFAVWTKRAAGITAEAKSAAAAGTVPADLLRLGAQLTDANAVLFDAAHGFHGCIPGIHEALRRVGLLAGRWCLNPREELSPGQGEEIDRIWAAYPHLRDDAFVAENLDRWRA